MSGFLKRNAQHRVEDRHWKMKNTDRPVIEKVCGGT
jgi:hypothetical protein